MTVALAAGAKSPRFRKVIVFLVIFILALGGAAVFFIASIMSAFGGQSEEAIVAKAASCVTAQGVNTGRSPDAANLDAEQKANVQLFDSVARGRSLGDHAVLLAILAAYTESGLRNLDHGTGSSKGLFQLIASTAAAAQIDPMDTTAVTKWFYDRLVGVSDWQTADPWVVAQKIEQSGTPDGSNYRANLSIAQTIASSLSGAPSTTAPSSSAVPSMSEADILAHFDTKTGECITPNNPPGPPPGFGVDSTIFDAGNLFSDAVFFNPDTMIPAAIQAFLDAQGGGCTDSTCLRNMLLTTQNESAPGCDAYVGGTNEKWAVVMARMAKACKVNPQVVLVMVQKESTGLSRSGQGWDAAMLGQACPDTGPGGLANCDPAWAGAARQTWGMITAFRRVADDPTTRQAPTQLNQYGLGLNHILYNVTGRCLNPDGSDKRKDVTIVSVATVVLYRYTPYTPSDESLAAYPGATVTGESKCDAYGIRNTVKMFEGYFGPGSTGGGKPIVGNGGPVVTPPGMEQNNSQDPASFGWVHAGPMESLVWQGHNFGQVAQGTAKLWSALLNELVPMIPGGLTNDLGCFEDRANVNNPSVLSFHAYGLACDLNTAQNPNGAPGYGRTGQYVLPAATHTIVAKYCMQWGGDFGGTPDPMHIEIHCTPTQIATWSAGHP